MATTNVDKIFKKIEKDFVELSKNAAKETATKAQKDIRQKADRFIKEYYAYKPRRYTDSKRKHALYKLVEDFYAESKTKNGIYIEFGIKYNPSNIAGIHQSNSWYHQAGTHWISRDSRDFDWDSQNNGIPEASWITEQFLAGIHPWSAVDSQSPDEKMQAFFDRDLENLIGKYINDSLLNEVAKYF